MSQIKEIISIEPPVGLSFVANRVEYQKSQIYSCTVCNGQGGKWNDQHTLEGEGWVLCTMCKGTGQIQDQITHQWVSAGQVKEQFKVE